jgi:hypothetical protein
MGLFSSKKTTTSTSTATSVQDRRIGAEGGSTIVAEGAALDASNRSTTNVSESTHYNLVDSDTAQASVEVLRDVSKTAIGETAGAFDTALSEHTLIFSRALDFAEGESARAAETAAGALSSVQATAAGALAKTASEGNQALETLTRAAVLIAGVFFVAQIFRS